MTKRAIIGELREILSSERISVDVSCCICGAPLGPGNPNRNHLCERCHTAVTDKHSPIGTAFRVIVQNFARAERLNVA